ncbi:MAG: hypothetical protein ACOH2A_10100 [Sphingobacteriaceae bacterium]
MEKPISKDQLVSIMLYTLASFNDEGVDLSGSTVHQEVLSDNDGFGAGSSKNIYKGAIDWVFWKNQFNHQSWPANWMEMNVADLADTLLFS